MKKMPVGVPILFVVIGIILAVVGVITKDFLWYIRTGIFWVAAFVTWVLFVRGRDR